MAPRLYVNIDHVATLRQRASIAAGAVHGPTTLAVVA
jgi:hypothetical protein